MVKLLGIIIKGYKKIKVVEFDIKEKGLTILKGDNGQGKTSIIEAIQTLFKGKKFVKGNPIRNGEKKAEIIGSLEIDGAPVEVKRIFTEKSDRIEILGKSVQKKTTFLNSLINELTFDPFPFLAKSAKEKVKFCLGVAKIDLSAENAKLIGLENDRLVCGRVIKAYGTVNYDPTMVPVDVKQLNDRKRALEVENNKIRDEYDAYCDKMQSGVEQHNADREKQVEYKNRLMNGLKDLERDSSATSKEISRYEYNIKENENKVKQLAEETKEKIKQIIEESEKKTNDLIDENKVNAEIIETKKSNIKSFNERILKANGVISKIDIPEIKTFTKRDVPLPEYASTEKITEAINEAYSHNMKCQENDHQKSKADEKQKKQDEYNSLDAEIQKVRMEKVNKLCAENLGVEGLEIKEDDIYYKGFPSGGWSDSEGVDISCRICLAQKPQLNAICVDRGEIFGQKKRDVLEKWAEENGISIIMTRVEDINPEDEIPEGTFVIEDGTIRL
jgi:DNA repair exonuclease SbcCD ATPase subunit